MEANETENQSETKYINACIKHFNCKPNEINIIYGGDYGYGHTVDYKEGVYNVWSGNDIESFANKCLTDEGWCIHLPLEAWILIAESLHTLPNFYLNVLKLIDNDKTLLQLNLALSISHNYNDNAYVFWSTLYMIDKESSPIFSKCAIALSKTFPLELLTETAVDYLVKAKALIDLPYLIAKPLVMDEGIDCHDTAQALTDLENGIFETVIMDENESNNENIYYIFNSIED